MYCRRALLLSAAALLLLASAADALLQEHRITFLYPNETAKAYIRPDGVFTMNFTASASGYVVFKASIDGAESQLEVERNGYWATGFMTYPGDTSVRARFKPSASKEGVYGIAAYPTSSSLSEPLGSSPSSLAVDLTPPTVSFTRAAEKTPNVRSAIFSWTATDAPAPGPMQYAYSLDGDAIAWVAAPTLELTELADGFHNLTAIAKDAAGNVGNSSQYNWLVDTVAPKCSIASPANGTSVSDAIDVEVDYNDTYLNLSQIRSPVTVCITDCVNATGMDYKWRASIPTGQLSSGTYTVKATCKDSAGNVGSDTATITVAHAVSTGPVGFSINGGARWANSTALKMTATSAPEAEPTKVRFACTKSSFTEEWFPYPSEYSFDLSKHASCEPSQDGIKNLWLQPGRGESAWPDLSSAYISLDRAPPEASASPLNGESIRTDTPITVIVRDSGPDPSGVSAVSLYYDAGSGLKRFQNGVAFVPGFSEGERGLFVKFSDAAGNGGTASFTYTVDNGISYSFSDTEPRNGSTIGASSPVSINVTAHNASLESLVYAMGSSSGQVQSGIPFSPQWAPGTNALRICAKASGSNEECRQYYFFADTQPPNVTLAPAPGTEIGQNWTLVASITDDSDVSYAWFDNGNGTRVRLASGVAFVPGWATPGAKSITVWANDSFGNGNETKAAYIVKEGAVQIDRPTGCVATQQTETECTNSKDDDCDGLADSRDGDCRLRRTAYEIASDATAYTEVEQGRTGTLSQTVRNTGDFPVDLDVQFVSPEAIHMMPPNRSLHLGISDTKAVEFSAHVPLSSAPGDYHVTFKYSGRSEGGAAPTKDSSVVVAVREATSGGATVSSVLSRLEADLNGYEKTLSGFPASSDVSEARALVEKERSAIASARKAIEDDDTRAMSDGIDSAKATADQILSAISSISMISSVASAAPYVLAAALIFLVAAYLASRYLMPLMDMRKRLAELKRQEKLSLDSRRATEIQYFRRQLDEKTFRGIMVQEQTKLMALRAQIADLERKTHGLFGVVLSLGEFKHFYAAVLRNKSFSAAGRERVHVASMRQRWMRPRQEAPAVHYKAEAATEQHVKSKKDRSKAVASVASLEKRLHSLRGHERAEAEALLRTAHEYAEKGMDSMAYYYIHKARRILRD